MSLQPSIPMNLAKHNNIRINLASDLVVDERWREYSLCLPERPDHQRHSIEFCVENCLLDIESGECFLLGEVFQPESEIHIEIGNDSGFIQRLSQIRYHVSKIGSDITSIHFSLPFDRFDFTKLKFKSTRPFPCRSVNWYNFKPKK